MSEILCRPATAADGPAARTVLEAAFGSAAEADLVDALARDGDLLAHIVAVEGGRVVGSLVLSPMGGMAALALAPLAVAPDRQRRGIGARLVAEAFAVARQKGVAAVFVLGSPTYYEPLGFSRAVAAAVRSPYAGPHFMAANLSGEGALPPVTLTHARAFAALG